MARDPVKISANLDDNAISNVIYTRISDGTDAIAINADGSLNITDNGGSITVDGSVTVTATDLDIRDLSASQDNVAISDGTDTLAVNNDGSINAVVSATDLDIRDLTHVSDSVKIGDGTDFLAVAADGSIAITDNGGSLTVDGTVTIQDGGNAISVDDAGGSLTVDATDLDIRDLTHVSDSIKVGDGTDLLAVNADGSINVVISGSSGTPVADYASNSLATTASANHDYTASGGAFRPDRVQVSAESIATFLIRTGPTGSLVTRAVLRTSVENPNAEFIFPTGFSIAATEVVRVVQTNDSNKTHTLDSTITGTQL